MGAACRNSCNRALHWSRWGSRGLRCGRKQLLHLAQAEACMWPEFITKTPPMQLAMAPPCKPPPSAAHVWQGLAHDCLNPVPQRMQFTASQCHMLDSSMRPLLQVKNRSRWTARKQVYKPKPKVAFITLPCIDRQICPSQIVKSCFRAARWPLSASFAHLVTGRGARRRS